MRENLSLIWMPSMPASLEHSIFNTLRYFDIFDLPLTVVQIWRSLIVDVQPRGQRWQGQAMPSLKSVRTILEESSWLRERTASRWGYYFLKGKAQLVEARLQRQVLAAHKWKIAQRVARLLAFVPFVRMIGVTGSLALSHTRPESDLDLFLVVRKGRIWTVRLLAIAITQLLGRRRKHWDRQAPDKACLNHYIAEDSLLMVPAVRSLYTAVLYAHLIPLMGFTVYEQWRDINMVWIKRWLMCPAALVLPPRHAVGMPARIRVLRRLLESWLLELPGDVVERWVGAIQRRTIWRHTVPGRSGRIAVSASELAFHPDSKEPAVLRRFYEEYGQQALL
jgi:hypothetical protein